MGRKSKQIRLEVLLNGKRVGILSRNMAGSGGLEFTYSEEWLQGAFSMPISQSLPLRESSYRGPEVESYFDNLLPDNQEIRRVMARQLATAGEGTLDLLAAIGRDCVGALRFILENELSETVTGSDLVQGERISNKDIGDVLRNLKSSPLGLDRRNEFRISIAGVQKKTALLRQNQHWYLPKGSTPTTHILKPAIGRFSNGIDMSGSVQNEWLCLKFAEHFGLPVAHAEMAEFDGVECLVVERFDREWSRDGKRLSRLPQEDFCQALGVPWSLKYESDGGPGIITIMNFLNASDQRERDRAQFLRAHLVFFLLGAIDGHAKNFSIKLLSSGFQLCPVYDMMTVIPALNKRQIEPKQARLAMSVGDNKHYRLGEIQRRHWEQTAKKAGFSPKNLQSLIQDLSKRAQQLDALANRLAKNISPQLLDSVAAGIKKRGALIF